MEKCLVFEEIARYREGALESVEELLAVEAHLDSCTACRDALLVAVSGAADRLAKQLEEAANNAPVCPEERLLTRYVEGRADATDQELVRTHSEDCVRCAAHLAALSASAAQNSPAAQPSTTAQTSSAVQPPAAAPLAGWWARLRAKRSGTSPRRMVLQTTAAMLAGAAATGILLTYGAIRPLQRQKGALETQNAQLQRRGSQQQQADAARLTQIQQESSQAQRAMRAQIEDLRRQLAHAPPEEGENRLWAGAIETAMATGKIPKLPSVLAEWSQQMRGGSPPEETALDVIGPRTTFVLEDQPTFHWKPLEGVTDYTVTVIEEGNQALTTASVRGTEWRAPRPLRRGQVYEWGVTARKGEATARSPIAKFLVLGEEQASAWRRAQQKVAHLPLTLGILYAQAGLLDDAEQKFKEALKADPTASLAQKLLHDVQSKR